MKGQLFVAVTIVLIILLTQPWIGVGIGPTLLAASWSIQMRLRWRTWNQ